MDSADEFKESGFSTEEREQDRRFCRTALISVGAVCIVGV